MKTIEVTRPAQPLQLALDALRSSRKRPGIVKTLPKLCYALPSVVLEADAVASYRSLCGLAPEHGVPLIYPQLLTFPLATAFLSSAACPWPALGTVHLANHIHQHQQLQVGDDLRVEMRTGTLMAHEKGQVFTLEFAVLRDNTLVWEATQVLLRIGVAAPSGKPYASHFAASFASDTPLSRQADFAASADIGRRYAKVSGDFNPIHLSALSARLFGFRKAIAHGLWTAARATAPLLPPHPLAQASLDVDFKTPLFLPGTASLWSTRAAPARGQLGAAFEVRNAAGDKPHLRARLAYAAT
jgi:acyl dehydratase